MPHIEMQRHPGRPGHFGPVRGLPRKARVALTKGPNATVELILNDDGTQRAVVSCPRNALKAFSELAKRLLVSNEHTNLQIPAGNVALGAVRYIMAWIPRCCEAADFMPIKRKEDFKQNVAVYQAALYLEMTEVLTTIGGLLNMYIDNFERHPWNFDEMSFLLLTLPRDCAMVNRLIEKVALTRRRGNLDQVFLWQLNQMCAAHPQLGMRFEEVCQQKIRPVVEPKRKSPVGERQPRNLSDRIISDKEVDFIMCRHHR